MSARKLRLPRLVEDEEPEENDGGSPMSMTSDRESMTSDAEREVGITSPEMVVAKDTLQLRGHAGKEDDSDQYDTDIDIDGGSKLIKLHDVYLECQSKFYYCRKKEKISRTVFILNYLNLSSTMQ